MRERREPPRAVTVVVLGLLAALLFYPLHRPYLHPDQDVPPTLPLEQMARGSWSPLILMYGSALPNLLHVLNAIGFAIGRALGWWREPVDLLVAWCDAPWLFRIPPRAIAMGAGVASLCAVRAITAVVADGWSALGAATILGTWMLFVREHHHGWYDAPASGCALLALWAATVAIRDGRPRRLVLAGALAGLAASFKFNLAPAVPAVLAGALVLPRGRRLAPAAGAAGAALLAFVVTTPESVLETARLASYLAVYIRVQGQVLAAAAGPDGNRLLETLGRAVGWSGLAFAAAGLVLVLRARPRPLVPLLGFGALYGLVLVRAPFALDRYALPIAGPLAILAGCTLARMPPVARAAAVAGLVALGLPDCVGFVRLLAVEDTRVEAARWIDAARARGTRIVVAANPVLATYVGPDLPALPRYEGGLPPDVERALAARAPRCLANVETVEIGPGTPTLAAHAGALVVTTAPPNPSFARASTTPATYAALAREATLEVDLPVGTPPPASAYEVWDLNYVPFSGFDALTRPGPHLQLWRVRTPSPDRGG
jgi:hypothetical protein